MTAGELIAKLQELPANTPIYLVDNYWAELNDIEDIVWTTLDGHAEYAITSAGPIL